MENLQIILVIDSQEHNEINFKLFQKVLKFFTPITMEDISIEIENPKYLQPRIVNLNSMIKFIQNMISTDPFVQNPFSFPYQNLKVNNSFFSYQREMLFRKIFDELYQTYIFSNFLNFHHCKLVFLSNSEENNWNASQF